VVTEPLREHVTRVAAHAPSSAAPHLGSGTRSSTTYSANHT
jgi:hypothetical protein